MDTDIKNIVRKHFDVLQACEGDLTKILSVAREAYELGRREALETAEAVHEAVEAVADRRVTNSADVMALLILHKILLMNSQAKGRRPQRISLAVNMTAAPEVIDAWELNKKVEGDVVIFTVYPRG